MTVTFHDITRRSPVYRSVKTLYREAFPKEERAPLSRLMRKVKSPNAQMCAIDAGGEWAGLLYMVHREDLTYIFYFAIDEKQRGRGIGTQAMKTLLTQNKDRRIFLAAEELDGGAPNRDERVRRQAFYRRCGFVPLKAKIQEAGVLYDVFSSGGDVLPEEYEAMMHEHLGKRWAKRVVVKLYRTE